MNTHQQSEIPEHFTPGEIRENMGHLGGFRYTLIAYDATHVRVTVSPLGQAIGKNTGNMEEGDTLLITRKNWEKFTLVSVPGINTDKIIDSLLRLTHEIRGRLANIIGGAKEKKNIPFETATRLRDEIYQRCVTIMMIRNGLLGSQGLFESVIDGFISAETLDGKRNRNVNKSQILKGTKPYEFIVSLLEVAGISKENAERFFGGSLNRTIKKNEISKD